MGTQNTNNQQCRTCLNETKSLLSLQKVALEDQPRDMSYGDLLLEVADINMEDDPGHLLPQFICVCCSRKLKNSHAFIRQAQASNKKLLSVRISDETKQLQAPDCLQESQIDIDACMEIKLEKDIDEYADDIPMMPCEVHLKTEGSEEAVSVDVESIEAKQEPAAEQKTEHASLEVELDSASSKDGDDGDYSPSASDSDDYVPSENEMEDTTPKPQPKKRRRRRRGKGEDDDQDETIAMPCVQCNKIFRNAKLLTRHLRNTHVPEEQKCSCPICGVKFTRACNMFKHMRTQHDPEAVKFLLPASEKMHECDKCPLKYTKKKHLNNHIKAKHSNETDDKSTDDGKAKAEERALCSFCGSSFSKNAYLVIHMRRHTGERPFQCDLCERSFAHNSELKSHRRIHTGEKPYKCKLCDKAFRVYKKLATHMRSHTDERPYKCSQCERSFKYSKDLNIHTRVHTGERPYCCNVCGSTFTQSNSLKTHRTKLGHLDENPKRPPAEMAHMMYLLS